jgi:adenosylcobinamide-GDP ribazoletransferase
MKSFDAEHGGDRWQHRPWRWWAQMIGSVTFYTQLPIPSKWPVNFVGIARYAPWIGLGIGGVQALGDWGLTSWGVPPLLRSGLVVALGVWITGGMHLDGAMDMADGWAAPDVSRRLAVMADSRTGAFGVMAALAVVGLKVLALADMPDLRGFALMTAAGWGRWGQVVAIARYPYLKPEGKGALHKTHAAPRTDWIVGGVPLLALTGWQMMRHPLLALGCGGVTLGGIAVTLGLGAWIDRYLGGHTGDTYGAIVEWTEVAMLCLMVIWQSAMIR